MPRRARPTGAFVLPLSLAAGALLLCNAALSGLRAQTSGSGTLVTSSSSSGGASSAGVSYAVQSAMIRTPVMFPRVSSSASSSQRAASTAPAAFSATSVQSAPQTALSDEEREIRALLQRVITAKQEQQVLQQGPTLTLGTSSAPAATIVVRASAPAVEPPGCFLSSGIWTMDGTSCARNQGEAFIQLRERPGFEQEPVAMGMPLAVLPIAMVSLAVPVEEAEEPRMTAVLTSWYPPLPAGTVDEQAAVLLMLRQKALRATLTMALTRLQASANDVRGVPSVAQAITMQAVWVQQSIGFLDAMNASAAQLDQMESDLRSRLQAAQEALWGLPSLPPNFVAMQAKIARIVDRAPLVFARLGTADIGVPSEAAELYLQARDLLVAVNACDGFLPCPELAESIATLQMMADVIDTAIDTSGEFWMYDEVDLMFSAE